MKRVWIFLLLEFYAACSVVILTMVDLSPSQYSAAANQILLYGFVAIAAGGLAWKGSGSRLKLVNAVFLIISFLPLPRCFWVLTHPEHEESTSVRVKTR